MALKWQEKCDILKTGKGREEIKLGIAEKKDRSGIAAMEEYTGAPAIDRKRRKTDWQDRIYQTIWKTKLQQYDRD